MEELSLLFLDKEPSLWIILGTVSIGVLYIFGDASVSGFGASWAEEDVVGFRFGVFNEEGAEIVITTESFEIWWRRWRVLAGIKGYIEERFSCAPIRWSLRAFMRQDYLEQKLSMT